jgi:hypothetical protein
MIWRWAKLGVDARGASYCSFAGFLLKFPMNQLLGPIHC